MSAASRAKRKSARIARNKIIDAYWDENKLSLQHCRGLGPYQKTEVICGMLDIDFAALGRKAAHREVANALWNSDFNDMLLNKEKRTTPKSKKHNRKKEPDKKMVSKSFYSSWDWKRARYDALKSAGRRCSCCGWTPSENSNGWLVVDHIKPLSKYPEQALDPSNLQVLCNSCNMGKGSRHIDDFREVKKTK